MNPEVLGQHDRGGRALKREPKAGVRTLKQKGVVCPHRADTQSNVFVVKKGQAKELARLTQNNGGLGKPRARKGGLEVRSPKNKGTMPALVAGRGFVTRGKSLLPRASPLNPRTVLKGPDTASSDRSVVSQHRLLLILWWKNAKQKEGVKRNPDDQQNQATNKDPREEAWEKGGARRKSWIWAATAENLAVKNIQIRRD